MDRDADLRSDNPRRLLHAVTTEDATTFDKDEPRTNLPHGGSKHVLALSQTDPDLLATSYASQIQVFDLRTKRLRYVLSGTGRTVTALALGPGNAPLVGASLIDGSISVWHAECPSRPIRFLGGTRNVCQWLAFSLVNATLIASIHGGELFVWKLDRRSKAPILKLAADQTSFTSVAWHPKVQSRFIATTVDGEVSIYNINDILLVPDTMESNDSDSDEKQTFVRGESTRDRVHLVSKYLLERPVKHISWVRDDTLLGLGYDGQQALVYHLEQITDTACTLLWNCTLETFANVAQMHFLNGVAVLRTFGRQGIEVHHLPSGLSDELKQTDQSSALMEHNKMQHIRQAGFTEPTKTDVNDATVMKPTSISGFRTTTSAFASISRQLQQRRLPARHRSRSQSSVVKDASDARSESTQSPAPTRSMTSSLELPNVGELQAIGSPMPFLSPGIPSQRASPNGIPLLEDSNLSTPINHQSPPTSPVPSTAGATAMAPDSDDSDDETFIEGLDHSTFFMPGGSNVPLPKACGALFAPNGQLLIFSPPRPSLARAREEVSAEDPNEKRSKGIRTARLFPTFGNLDIDAYGSDEESASDISGSLVSDAEQHSRPSQILKVDPSFSTGRWSWKNRISPTKPDFAAQESLSKVLVSVHEIHDLFPAQLKLAEEYRVMCDYGESGFELCKHNASTARGAGLEDIANVWCLISKLLEDKLPLERLYHGSQNGDIMVTARRASVLMKDHSAVLIQSTKQYDMVGKLRWAGHPFGRASLVKAVLEWAERRADIQLLACISAILFESVKSIPTQNMKAEDAIFTKLPTYTPDYFSLASLSPSISLHARPTPTLRMSNVLPSVLHRSPSKFRQESNPTSQNTSQPTTPYPDSGPHSTPPGFFSLSRQSTKLSVSGSASPEMNRGSWGTAIRSVTDKFNTSFYGSSPPVRKTDVNSSPGNELSTSFPGGSWPGKSVSFASTTTMESAAPQRSLLSWSVDMKNGDDGYDSDRTIEDSSAPHTPKSPGGGAIVVTSKNPELLSDEEAAGYKGERLLSDDWIVKARIWCQYYAEQLRTWDLLGQAVELEKVAGLTITLTPTTQDPSDGIIPQANTGQSSKRCGICHTSVKGIETTCPSCLHISHLSCVQNFTAELDGDGFECPTGCGCLCSELPFLAQELHHESSTGSRPLFKKKPSYTDPRRWRARIEGDSW